MNSLTIATELLSKLDTVDSLTLRIMGERLARAVVAESSQSEPVAWKIDGRHDHMITTHPGTAHAHERADSIVLPLYTHPLQIKDKED